MELRKAKREDLEQIMELIDNAKCFLRSQGSVAERLSGQGLLRKGHRERDRISVYA